jgi:hypothetical protein
MDQTSTRLAYRRFSFLMLHGERRTEEKDSRYLEPDVHPRKKNMKKTASLSRGDN